ncbi:MAG TPA: ROK family protein, partial [Rhodobacteraceae bacterium]|nr:ROK family protein [Paracoccaceae bacterium]
MSILGIEVGGTKLQLGIGAGDGSGFVAFERRDIDIAKGAAGILT